MAQSLPVMESFLSIQGEGFHQGSLAFFIRLAGCDVGCPWCDVKESWEVSDDQIRSIDDIVTEAASSGAEMVIITGGEPLLYDLDELTKELNKKGMKCHLETSGAYPLTGNFEWVCLSPKKFKVPLEAIYDKAHELKVVIANKKDLEWAEKEAAKVNANCKLFLQAEWDRRERQYEVIYSYIALNPRWKISVQNHKYLGLP